MLLLMVLNFLCEDSSSALGLFLFHLKEDVVALKALEVRSILSFKLFKHLHFGLFVKMLIGLVEALEEKSLLIAIQAKHLE
jgi:hypothetical protein